MIETNKFKKALQHLLPVFAVFLATSTAMWAQAGGGSMVGTVHDPAGAVVPNAAVTITNSRHQHYLSGGYQRRRPLPISPIAGRQLQGFGVCAAASKKPFRKALRSRSELRAPSTSPSR